MNRLPLSVAVPLSALIISACAVAQPSTPTQLAELQHKLQIPEDLEAIRDTGYCYGRAQDVVYRNYADTERAKCEGLEAFRRCFTDDATFTITFFGSEPVAQTPNLEAWVDFVIGFGQDSTYTSTRHLISNFEIELTGPDSAVMYSSGVNPHFIQESMSETGPAVDWLIGNYRDELRRIDGVWKVTGKTLNADEFLRSPGFYPNGQSDGSGNIGI